MNNAKSILDIEKKLDHITTKKNCEGFFCTEGKKIYVAIRIRTRLKPKMFSLKTLWTLNWDFGFPS